MSSAQSDTEFAGLNGAGLNGNGRPPSNGAAGGKPRNKNKPIGGSSPGTPNDGNSAKKQTGNQPPEKKPLGKQNPGPKTGDDRKGRNVRPLPITPPPMTGPPIPAPPVDAPPIAPPPADAPRWKGETPAEPPPPEQEPEPSPTLDVHARPAVSKLRRSSRTPGMGVAVTLVVGLLLLIVMSVAVLLVLNDDSREPGSSGDASSDNAGSAAAGTATNPGNGASIDRSPGTRGVGTTGAAAASNEGDNSNSAANRQNRDSGDGNLPFTPNRTRAPRAIGNSQSGGSTQSGNPPPVDSAVLAALPTSHVMDDGDARLSGEWHVADRNREEHAGARYHGEGFRIDSGTFGEKATAEYSFPPLRPGNYRVSISFPAGPNRASNAAVIVKDAEGSHEVAVNQTEPPERGLFLTLGDFRVDASDPLVVRFDNEGLFGFLAIDAVKAENLDVPADDQ